VQLEQQDASIVVGEDYALADSRGSVGQNERHAVVDRELGGKPRAVVPALFAGAFLAHHRHEKPEVVEEIYSKLGDKHSLIEKLAEMYNEPISTLLDEPEEGKNLEWTPNW